MAENSGILLVDQAPHYQAKKVENWAAKNRGKENLIIDDKKELFPSLFSKSATRNEGNGRDNIAGLAKEYIVLERLKNSGVSPEPLAFKLSADRSKAHLLMTKVPGQSIEKIDSDLYEKVGGESKKDPEEESTPETEALISRFNDVISSAAKSLDIVHSKNVLVVDINAGTYIMDCLVSSNELLRVSVVDFEIAKTTPELEELKVKQELTLWYSLKDPAVVLGHQAGKFELTADRAKKIESCIGVKVFLEHFLGADFNWKIDPDKLPPEIKMAYDKQMEEIGPRLAGRAKVEVARDYQGIKDSAAKDQTMTISTEEEFFKYQYPLSYQALVNGAMINITLPVLLEQKGIKVDPIVLNYLQQVLNPDIDTRPSSFPQRAK